MSLAARLTAGTTLFRTLGIQRTIPISAATTAIAPRVMLPPSCAVAVDARRGDRGRDQEQDHLDRAADAGAEHHRAPAGRDRDVLVVEVVELQRGAADAVRRDQVEEAARELDHASSGRRRGPSSRSP